MPSLRVMSALAVVVLTARPARSFLGPISTPGGPRRGGSVAARSSASSSSAFRGRQPRPTRGSSNPSQRNTAQAGEGRAARTALAMGKKKGGGKKKAAAAAAKKKAQAATGGAGGVGGATDSAAAVIATAATAVAEHDEATSGGAEAAAAAAPITNRADGEEPVVSTTTAAAPAAPKPIMEAAVNGAPKKPVPAATAAARGEGAGGAAGAQGFGAAPPQPRPMQKGLNRKQGTEPQGQSQGQGQGQGQAARPAKASPPGVKGGAGFDALATGVPVAGNTDHERVITDLEFSEPEPQVAATEGARGKDGEMSPADMLRYLRDNNLTIDLETMNPVVMPKEPVAKMEAIFPKPAANVRAQYDLGASPKPSDFAQAIIGLLPEDEPWNGAKIRPLPELKDFLLANRLHAGNRGLNAITSLMLKAMSEGDLDRSKFLKGAAICYTKAENTITAPFRQAVMFAENRLAPCMGSTVCEEYAGDDGADAAATWVVLKACVAEWELRLREIRQEEVGLHDIFRTMPNPTEGLDEERTAAITGSVQAMGLSFGSNEKLMQAVPPEVRFLEGSLGLNTTTEVRRFAMQEFCPQEGISPDELRFRLRSVMCGMDQLPSKSYHQLQVAVTDVYDCLVEGTPEAYCMYMDNWSQGEDLSFQTYRLDTGEVWRDRLREIVTAPIPQREEKEDYESLFKEILPRALWNFATSDESASYELPFVRLKEGWWESLDFLDEDKMADKRMREAAVEASKMKDPSLMKEGEEPEMDDIFTDFLKEEKSKMEEFEFSEAELDAEVDDDEDPDGPGPDVEMLDLGF
ncbi:unnamed protein product [Laminaria digitata]